MGSNPHKYSATLDTPFPAVISLASWSGSLVDLFNGIPSSAYNDIVYPVLSTEMAAKGYDLISVTNSYWINYNGKLAFYFDFVADPPTAEEAAAIVAAIAGILVGLLVTTLTSWSTVIAVVLGALAAIATFEFINVFVVDQGPLYSGTTTPPPPSYTGTGQGGSCSSTSQCAQGLSCQSGACQSQPCSGVIIGSTCVPMWSLALIGIGAVGLIAVVALAKKRWKGGGRIAQRLNLLST